MTSFIIIVLVFWLVFKVFKKEKKIVIKKNTKIDFNKIRDAEFEDNE